MTNWKKFTITKISNNSRYLTFGLSGYVDYKNGRYNSVYPYNSFSMWDEIEIDIDEAKNYGGGKEFKSNDDVVRKYNSNSTADLVPTRMRNNQGVVVMQQYASSDVRDYGNQLLGSGRSGQRISVRGNTRTGDYQAEIVQYDPKSGYFG